LNRFCVVTPTIAGRGSSLIRGINSVRQQGYPECLHVVCGDGQQPEVRTQDYSEGLVVTQTEKNHGSWGFGVRNQMVAMFKEHCDYFLFLDDDNILLPHSLKRLDSFISDHHAPPLCVHRVLYHWPDGRQVLMPTARAEIDVGNMDTLCICARADVAAKMEWKPVRAQDMQFTHDCLVACGGDRIRSGWKDLLQYDDLLGYVDEVLGVYYGA